MKKIVIISVITALIVSSCGESNVKNQVEINSTEKEEQFVIKEELLESELESVEGWIEKEGFGNKQNPLYGKNVKNMTQWTYWGSSIISVGLNEDGSCRFRIGYFKDESGDRFCTFEEIVRPYGGEKTKYIILDTVNLGKLKDNENFEYCNCRLNTIEDSEIVAIVIWEDDKKFLDKIIRAWRADTKTGLIKPIEIEGIDCENKS